MLYMVTGGSASGKSEYAENLAVSQHKKNFSDGNLFYVATMYPYDEESRQRVKKHQNMRQGKGFQTMEKYVHDFGIHAGRSDVFLLECMSNLLANEMYLEEGWRKKYGKGSTSEIPEIIVQYIDDLEKKAGCVVVVTNEIFSDGMEYDPETAMYIQMLGEINQILAKKAEGVVEVVCSIPIYQKGALLCFDQ